MVTEKIGWGEDTTETKINRNMQAACIVRHAIDGSPYTWEELGGDVQHLYSTAKEIILRKGRCKENIEIGYAKRIQEYFEELAENEQQ